MSSYQPGTGPVDSAATMAMSNRVFAGSLMSALVFIGIAMFFVFFHPTELPPYWVFLAQLLAGVAVHGACESIGYQAQPLATSTTEESAATAATAAWRQGQIIRFALCEAIAIFSLAGAFILERGGFLTYLGGAVVSLVLMMLHVWPGARPVGKVADALEANGRRSGLREAFGHAPAAGAGPIQRL